MTATTTRPPRHLVRSASAILAGFVLIVALSMVTDLVLEKTGVFPPQGQPMQGTGLFLLALAYRTAFGVVGGYVTAQIAPSRPIGHALILGAIGFVVSCLGVAATLGKPEMGAAWYPIALVVTAIPSTWLGGWLCRPKA